MVNMLAKFNTRSNFKNLNGLWIPVVECKGQRITCVVYDPEVDKRVQVDFTLSELTELNSNPTWTQIADAYTTQSGRFIA